MSNDQEADQLAAVGAFNEAFNAHDIDAVMDLMTDDCVFESTQPPDGVRHEGRDAVRAAFVAVFEQSPVDAFTTELTIVAKDVVVVPWRYTWSDEPDGHIRGVDVFHFRGSVIREKCAYVKG